jgi:hypothetical protein
MVKSSKELTFPQGNKRIKCKDGFSMSVQASRRNYCEPRINNAVEYSKVEVGFPSAEESLLNPYMDGSVMGPKAAVYGYVPSHVVVLVCAKHGGVIEGDLPPGIPFIKANQ